uniref:Glutathione synthetase n=1 Tax=Globodera rostochiensis TaxID=31243 RepID=A0A914ICM3_GLORO
MKIFLISFLLAFLTVCANSTQPDQKTTTDEDEGGGDVQVIYEDAVDFAQNLSLTFLPSDHEGRGDVAEIVPFTLFPTPFPKHLFEQAKQVQLAYLLLYFRISNDFDFLIENYEEVAKTNTNVKNYLHILKTVQAEGIKQKNVLLLGRSDYMCHKVMDDETNDGQHYELKQIEFNTGQLGGVHVSRNLTQLHRRTMLKAGLDPTKEQMPDNPGDMAIAEALYMAWTAFGDPEAIFLFAASKTSRNRFGQRLIEYLLEEKSKGKMKVIRISLPDCADAMKTGGLTLDPEDSTLRLYGQKVAVTYIATEPPNPSRGEWAVRLLFERSTAIKSPTIGQDLANQKKIQQLLAKPGMVERFLPEPENAANVAAIRSTFAGLWPIHDQDDKQSQQIIQDAIQNPDKYVLKPNREGGGNNIWGEKVKEKLLTFTPEEQNAHILMERLNPMVVKNYMVRPRKVIKEKKETEKIDYAQMTTELSIIGYLFGNAHDLSVQKNVQKGHFLRTKMATENEGGVSFGTGAWDTPFLF